MRGCICERKQARLVGVSTSAKTPKGSGASACRMGSAKAAVLPLPVCAVPSTSRPARMAGMQPACTGVGRSMPSERHTLGVGRRMQHSLSPSFYHANCMWSMTKHCAVQRDFCGE